MKHALLLSTELVGVRAELNRVDAKCQMLAGLSGAAAAFTATQVIGHGPAITRWMLGLAGVVLAAATVLLLAAVIRPRLGVTGFCQYADLPYDDVEALFKHGRTDRRSAGTFDPTAVEAEEVELIDLMALSRLVKRKYTWLRGAVDLSAAGVVFIGLGVLAGAIS